MGVRVVRVACAAACLLWLAGCETTSTSPDSPFKKLTDALNPPSLDKPLDSDITGSVNAPSEFTRTPMPTPGTPPPLRPELLGSDPNDDLSVGKKYYQQGSYGLAERHFRRAVELTPRDAEAWVGLAAAYDRLRRFDLADRAYAQAIKLIGETPEVMNNQGFSYILRSDYRRARAILLAAQAKAPDNPHIAANLQLLGKAERKAKGIN
jgi:tetratricopeptide (TPR) repeat protein